MDLIRRAMNPFTNGSTSLADLSTNGAGLSGGYMGDSFAIMVLIVFFPGLAIYNAVELLLLIFFTFNKYRGVYFWSILISSIAVIPYSLGFLFKFANITQGSSSWFAITLITIGWYGMVTGQSAVLWSRLHLILDGEKGRRTLRWTKWMIIIDAIILHIPTSVFTYGSNGHINTETFRAGYNIMEKIQMSGFFIQEVILSSIYILATVKVLKTSIRDNTKRLMWQLMGVNIIIIVMDMGLLGLEAASLYLLETLIKGVIYSVKLKLEFAILGRLVQFVGRPGTSVANEDRVRRASVAYFGNGSEKTSRDTLRSSELGGFGPGFVSDFAELSRLRKQSTNDSVVGKHIDLKDAARVHTRQRSRAETVRLPPGMTMDDVDFAMFQHTEDTSLPAVAPGKQTAQLGSLSFPDRKEELTYTDTNV